MGFEVGKLARDLRFVEIVVDEPEGQDAEFARRVAEGIDDR